MAKSTFQLGEYEAFSHLLKQLIGDPLEPVTIAATQSAVTLDGIVRRELPPEPRKKSVSKWWTARQRAWWWATMHAAASGKGRNLRGWKAVYKIVDGVKVLEISGAYKRTGGIVQSLAYDVQQIGEGVAVRYGTNKKYAKWVIDAENQSKYHQGNWKTLQDIAEESIEKMQAAFEETLMQEIEKRLA